MRWAAIVALCLWLPLAFADESPRFLILHVDATTAIDLDRMLAEGRLPNVSSAFEGGMSFTSVGLYPGSTPVIVSRLHGRGPEGVLSAIGFGGFDRETGRVVPEQRVFLDMLWGFPRRSWTNFVHGAPGLDGLAGLAMQNLPELLERYRVIEFYWFNTDGIGHLFGAEAHAVSLERFDAHLGRVLPQLGLDDLNLILYTDHGMTFGTVGFDVDALLEERLGDEMVHFKYPNLYLRDPARAQALARRLTAPGGLDFAFYRRDERRVEGYLNGAFVRFEAVGDGIRYASPEDPLGYAELGYDGAALTRDGWVALTRDALFPATPPNVFDYLQISAVGDLVVGLNPPRVPGGMLEAGNHAGLVQTDLVVKVLARGPQVQVLEERGLPWLHELYRSIPELEFGHRPVRELHEFEVRYDLEDLGVVGRMRWSPAYRVRVAAELGPPGWAAWGEVDVFSSYLTRWWLGVGASSDDAGWGLMVRGMVEVDVGDARLRVEGGTRPSGWSVGVGATFRVARGVRLAYDAPGAVGVSFEW